MYNNSGDLVSPVPIIRIVFFSHDFYLFSNDEIISSASGRGYFSLSFFFENGNYVDIMTVFKEENKAKRIRPDAEVIVLSLLSRVNSTMFLMIHVLNQRHLLLLCRPPFHRQYSSLLPKLHFLYKLFSNLYQLIESHTVKWHSSKLK